MKIKLIQSQENVSDILELNGNDLTINGDSQTLTLDSEILINVDNQHFFLSTNKNALLHCGIDIDDEITLSELSDFIDFYNLSDTDKKIEYKKNIDKYEKKVGKKKGDWNKFCREVKADKTKIVEK